MVHSSRYLLFTLFSYVIYHSQACDRACDNKWDSYKCESDSQSFKGEMDCARNPVDASVLSIPHTKRQSMELRLNCSAPSTSCYFVFLFSDNTAQGDCARAHLRVGHNYTRIRCLQMSCSESVEVVNLTSGDYCTMFYERSLECRGDYRCKGLDYYSMSTKLPSNASDVSVALSTNEDAQYYVIVLLLILFAILVVVIGIAVLVTHKLRRKIHERFIWPETKVPNLESVPKKKISEVLESRKATKVFVLYSRDCEHQQEFVTKLATFFSRANCAVSFAAWEVAQIATNKVGWLNEKLSGEYKVLLLCSRKGFEKQRAWLANKASIHEQTTEDQLYLQAIATLMHRTEQAFDYTKLFILRPSFVSAQYVARDLCPGRQYVLPQHLPTLLCHVHEVDTKGVALEEEGEKQWGASLAPAHRDLLRSLDRMSQGDSECGACAANLI